ncbi:MAG TPA: succinylglutamate desuccinylase/aspartoacylase family protein [Myxococcota bacterium]
MTRALAIFPLLCVLGAARAIAQDAPGAAAAVVPAPPSEPAPQPVTVTSTQWDEVVLLGRRIAPGDKRRLFLRTSESFSGSDSELPVLVTRGATPGPTVCLIAGVHGDELNGIEIVRKVVEGLTPRRLSGMVIAVPVANLHGFRRSSRYLPDRRDLNRFFPGTATGSSASRIANSLWTEAIRHCSSVIDLHTGSFHRTNLPQVRIDTTDARSLALARGFGSALIIHDPGIDGTLRRAARRAGIGAITYEAGEPLRFQEREIARGVEGVRNVLAALGMSDDAPVAGTPRVYQRTRWVRVDDGGIFFTRRRLGETVNAGDLLGTVTDPVTNESKRVEAPVRGRIIGMAVPQVVIPGYAAFHLGVDATQPFAANPADDAPRLPDPDAESARGEEAEREMDPEVAPE